MCAWYRFKRYVPVAKRRADSARETEKLRKNGKDIQSVHIEGRKIAKSFWGAGWCSHMESFSDFENRLPRGRTYVRNGSVCHLAIREGEVEALVSGSSLYTIRIEIAALPPGDLERVKKACTGRIGSILELLKGNLSDEVMAVVTDRKHGLFPKPGEMKFRCDCPDWAGMCKHIAAALYGVGHRLDRFPELLFKLRGVDTAELVGGALEIGIPAGTGADATDAIAESALESIFGIEIETQTPAAETDANGPPAKSRTRAATGKAKTKRGVAKRTASRPAARKGVPVARKPASVARKAAPAPKKARGVPKKVRPAPKKTTERTPLEGARRGGPKKGTKSR